MESYCLDRYAPLETALKEAGFVVTGTGRKGKKTVIIVSRSGQAGETLVFPAGPSRGAEKNEDPEKGGLRNKPLEMTS